jgi:hypothetical protein
MGWLGEGLKLRILMEHALTAAKRLFVIPDFRYYAAGRWDQIESGGLPDPLSPPW